jgi:carboxymethylenebutenolidase
MTGKMIEFRANGRSTNGWLALPEQGSGPGLIVIQEYWGLVDHIKNVTDRFAAAGFVALAPDFYEGRTTKVSAEAGREMMALDIEQASKTVGGAADYLLSLDAVTPKKVAVIGFCMGGQLALQGACDYPDRICAAVDFYGIHPKVQPRFERLSGPVQTHFGEHDEYIPLADARALVERIGAAGVHVESHFYSGSGHAFFNDARPEVYNAADAKIAWERAVTFLHSQLAL